MNPIRREIINGLFVLVISTLLSAGFAAFQVSASQLTSCDPQNPRMTGTARSNPMPECRDG